MGPLSHWLRALPLQQTRRAHSTGDTFSVCPGWGWGLVSSVIWEFVILESPSQGIFKSIQVFNTVVKRVSLVAAEQKY